MRVVVPVVFALVAAAASVLGFVLWTSRDVDARSLQRQTSNVARTIGEAIETVSHDQDSVARWDDSVVNTRYAFDAQWVDDNLGVWMHDFFGHDRVVVLNSDGNAIYAMDAGASADPAIYAGMREAVTPIVARLRGDIAGGAIQPYLTGHATEIPFITDVTLIEGQPAIVSVMPIVSDTREIFQEKGTEFLHVSVVWLNDKFADKIRDRYLFESGRFTSQAIPGPDSAVLPIRNLDGRFVTFFEWKPDRPGTALLNRTVPVLVAAFIVAGLVAMLLLNRLSHSASAVERARRIAEHEATHDSLTGLPNRHRFELALADAIRRTDQGALSLIMLNIDGYKRVVDTHGHGVGDDLIRGAARRIETLVGKRDLISRIGSDEFAILYLGPPGEPLDQMSEHLVTDLARPFEIGGTEVYVSASAGIAIADGAAGRDLLRDADIALMEAKAAGGGRAVFFEQRMVDDVQYRHTIEGELRDALRGSGQISVLFQPLFDQATGRIVGAEALTRWNHPTMGAISPALFIPIAEASGLIEQLGDLVLNEACRLGARWPGMRIAVNLSPAQLRSSKFPARLFTLLRRSEMQPEDLELEITEGMLLEDTGRITDTLATFRAAGVKIALDDFGTGYSSLNYLKRYAVDRIKIDQSFVGQLPQDRVSVAIVDAIISMAHALDIKVTAEGVETVGQRNILARLHCDSFQGYLLSRPVEAAAVEALFATAENAATVSHRRRA